MKCFLLFVHNFFGCGWVIQRRLCVTVCTADSGRSLEKRSVVLIFSLISQSQPFVGWVVLGGSAVRCSMLAARPNNAKLYRGKLKAHTINKVFMIFCFGSWVNGV